jgi:hypothetical protein
MSLANQAVNGKPEHVCKCVNCIRRSNPDKGSDHIFIRNLLLQVRIKPQQRIALGKERTSDVGNRKQSCC